MTMEQPIIDTTKIDTIECYHKDDASKVYIVMSEDGVITVEYDIDIDSEPWQARSIFLFPISCYLAPQEIKEIIAKHLHTFAFIHAHRHKDGVDYTDEHWQAHKEYMKLANILGNL